MGKSLFVRQHQDGESLVVKIDVEERAMRMRADPQTFYITDHYLNYPWILVRLKSVDPDDLRDLLEEAWRLSASKRLLAAHENDRKRRSQGKSLRSPEEVWIAAPSCLSSTDGRETSTSAATWVTIQP